ncbi:MAG: L-threonylcarbamoyladenylate synthase [Candidatus Magasanikbacteria bacterium]
MQIIKSSQLNIQSIVDSLHDGKTIIYPTETCYGLGCDATHVTAVEHIYNIKQRPVSKSLLVVTSDIEMMKGYVEWNQTLDMVAKKYWPGPLTVVVPIKQGVILPKGIVSSEGTVAFRITSHPIAQKICSELRAPLVSTSANISGGDNAYTPIDVIKTFEHELVQPDICIDAGELPVQKPSTIIAIKNGNIEIVRQGSVIIEHL